MTRLSRLAARLRREAKGATIVEFALIAPALLMTIFGVFDLGYHIYASTQLEGAIQKAARDSSIEGASPLAIDDHVRQAVRQIVPNASLSFSRKAYADFSDVGRAEDFTDVDGDGTCDNGEPFEDANGNNIWDSDRGRDGQGGARDAVLYEVTVTFERPFPVASLIGMSPTVTTVARTVLRNQPYDVQNRAVSIGHCA